MMSVALSEESSNTTPTSAGFASRLEVTADVSLSKRSDAASSPVSDAAGRRPSTPPLLRPSVGQTFVGHVKSWGDGEIAAFLSLYRCDQYTPLFHRNDIDGKVLLDLDMSSLKEIGIAKIGDRVKLLSGVRELRKRAARVPPPPPPLNRGGYSSIGPTEGSPIPVEQDAKGSQVPKRLATALVSKRLQLSRPPPLNLQRLGPVATPDGMLPIASPSSRVVTPKSHHQQNAFKTPGADMTAAMSISQEHSSASLRPPFARDHRRSPSPNTDDGGPASMGRPDTAKHRPGMPRFSDSPHRVDPKTIPPTQRSSREGNAPHPFASAMRHDGSKGGSEPQRRAFLRPVHNGSHTMAMDPSHRPGQPSLEDLRRHVVKFVNFEDGRTSKVDVSSCTSGVEVLERVLKKFGKWNTGMGTFGTDSDAENDRLEVDGWGVFIQSEGAEEGGCRIKLGASADRLEVPLSESALLDVCQGHRSVRIGIHNDPAVLKENGLLLRRVSHSVNRKNMEVFFGDTPPPPRSPGSPSYYGAGVPRLGDTWDHDSPAKAVASKKTNRASTVSIMSSLGVPGAVEPAPPTDSARSSTIDNATSRSKKMYNFFGHRPPSELISNHLADYFPSARKRDLEKTVRQSMMRLSQGQAQGLAVGQVHPVVALNISPHTGPADAASPNRKARPPSTRTVSSSTTPAAIPEEVETSQKEADAAAAAAAAEHAAAVDTHPPLLPPFESTGESLVDSLQQYSPAPSTVRPALRQGRRGSSGSTLSRISVISSIRKSKDKSDTASLLTVDEITAEVENRRASMSTFIDPQEPERPFTPAASDVFPSEDDISDSSPSDTESEQSSDTTDSEDHGQGRAFTSAGCESYAELLASLADASPARQIIKWIKGALIGAGSFGSVFLGMDAHSGLLMAVKQVDLPSGDARNEEKKRSTVQALEREIELLRELQHENIVQYLGKQLAFGP